MIPCDIFWPALKPPPNPAEQGKVVEEPVSGKKGGGMGKGGITRTSPSPFALFFAASFIRLFSASASSALAGDTGSLEDLRDYTRQSLASFPDDQSVGGKVNDRSRMGITLPTGLGIGWFCAELRDAPTRDEIGKGVGDGEGRRGSEEERETEEAVEILTWTSKKGRFFV